MAPSLDISVLACSKGAEVYSILWIMRSARPDLKISMHALDISQEILEFAERGVYSLTSPDVFNASNREAITRVEMWPGTLAETKRRRCSSA